MYLTIQESRELAAQLVQWQQIQASSMQLIVCPSAPAMHQVEYILQDSGLKLGAQQISFSSELGAHTSQVSAQQLKELNCSSVILGHSEVRSEFHVSDQQIHEQLLICLEHGFLPVICVGETAEEKQNGLTHQVIIKQLSTIFSQTNLRGKKVIIAYEPRWAIGAGVGCDPEVANSIHELIAQTMKEYLADSFQLLYGGSVDSSNIDSYLQQPFIDGAIIGGASSKWEKLLPLLESSQRAEKG